MDRSLYRIAGLQTTGVSNHHNTFQSRILPSHQKGSDINGAPLFATTNSREVCNHSLQMLRPHHKRDLTDLVGCHVGSDQGGAKHVSVPV
jgi:hypothetical protein